MSDTEALDRLAQIINEHMEVDVPETVADKHEPVDADYAMADAIIAAGWRPPVRVVSTVGELDALVAHTVVRYCTRYGWGTAEKAVRDRWWPVGDAAYITNTQVLHYGPATVLWEPEEGE